MVPGCSLANLAGPSRCSLKGQYKKAIVIASCIFDHWAQSKDGCLLLTLPSLCGLSALDKRMRCWRGLDVSKQVMLLGKHHSRHYRVKSLQNHEVLI
jgi:hypothetical protein